MTVKAIKDLTQVYEKQDDLYITHNPSNQYTVLEGYAGKSCLYDALSMVTFNALKKHGIIKQAAKTNPDHEVERWDFVVLEARKQYNTWDYHV